jgi:hypothetical protein
MNHFTSALKLFMPAELSDPIPIPVKYNIDRMLNQTWIEFLVGKGAWEEVPTTYKVGDKFVCNVGYLNKHRYMLVTVGRSQVTVVRDTGENALEYKFTTVKDTECITEAEMHRIFPSRSVSSWASGTWKKVS